MKNYTAPELFAEFAAYYQMIFTKKGMDPKDIFSVVGDILDLDSGLKQFLKSHTPRSSRLLSKAFGLDSDCPFCDDDPIDPKYDPFYQEERPTLEDYQENTLTCRLVN